MPTSTYERLYMALGLAFKNGDVDLADITLRRLQRIGNWSFESARQVVGMTRFEWLEAEQDMSLRLQREKNFDGFYGPAPDLASRQNYAANNDKPCSFHPDIHAIRRFHEGDLYQARIQERECGHLVLLEYCRSSQEGLQPLSVFQTPDQLRVAQGLLREALSVIERIREKRVDRVVEPADSALDCRHLPERSQDLEQEL